MTSSYSLPTPPLQHIHDPRHSHSHSHTHSSGSVNSLSQSPPSVKTLRTNDSISSYLSPEAQSANGSRKQLSPVGEGDGRGGGQLGRQSSGYEPVANGHASRERMAPPAPINVAESWKEEGMGGRILMTPATSSMPIKYQLPRYTETACSEHHHQHHGHDHAHPHQHSHHDHDHDHAHHSHDHHSHSHSHSHSHAHAHSYDHSHGHNHGASSEKSFLTRALLKYCASWPLLHAILAEKDSRRIFYYMCLNVSFMVVQAFYGYVTESLGLLSDTVHMFFDCVALLVGLVAAVASKWPRSQRFPYGLGKMETLSGFANGILLILLSVEITFEAVERIWEGSKPKRLGELLIVSILGLLVNLVGITSFGHHHHHGHDHGHSHGHSHGHENDGGCSHSHDHAHGHSHDNENMHGIYLHILADTLGSASVIVSTILTYFTNWGGWDPTASVFISVLIFLSARPLVISSAKRLLLSVPDDVEYSLRNILAGISQQQGVVGCAVPKFWLNDRDTTEDDKKEKSEVEQVGSVGGRRLLGIVHVVAGKGSSLDDVRDRVRQFLLRNGMDLVVQVEREGDATCWCGFGRTGGPSKANGPKTH
ncbi:hypothetical protein jhhlp_005968 [Lomentospora prolificans]|uniref:Zinc transporter n=1 Tax=Lomentospora prolificans TaxID=41688 RepID=A0A2N3N4L2_9PEZI|nr:hypothetical protein jhhlp_005968 [Lomentospora prolificans]